MGLIRDEKIHAFGLDISDSSIKIADIVLSKGQIQSASFADVPLLDKTVSNHVIVNQQRLADNIARALQQVKGLETKFVISSVPETKSFVRLVQIPKMSEAEIDGAIPFEVEQDIPIPISEVYLDWQVLRELPDKLELLVTASSKDYIDALVETLHLAKLQPLAMEIGSQATARALIGPENMKKSVLIVDIGARQTSFIVVDEGVPFYTSSIPLAGNSFTESIARTLGITWAQAEQKKLTSGLVGETGPEADMGKAVFPLLDNIIEEIKNVMKFFEEHAQNQHRIEAVVLCGGSSRVPGVLEYIYARINLGSQKNPLMVTQGNPWVNVPNASKVSLPMSHEASLNFATVIGLALRGMEYSE